jgi:hypothetical protein
VVVVKVFPAQTPGNPFHEDIKRVNAALDKLNLEADPKVQVLDLWGEMVNPDGTLKSVLFTPDSIHLTQEGGYELYASRLRPLVEKLLGATGSTTTATEPAKATGDGGSAAGRTPIQYLLLNYSASPDDPKQSTDIMTYVQRRFGAANRASALKVGVAVIYTPKDQVQQWVTAMANDLTLAQRLDVPILIQVDTENWLPESLLNWYDPAKPGYDPAKTADVEWYGWGPENAVKLCWRNWGVPLRVGPQPNLLSPRFQAWEKTIYDGFIPPVLEWYNALPASRKWLFVGWKCGWETTLNSTYVYFADGNSYYGRAGDPSWDTPKLHLGYNAAQTAGLKTSGDLDYKTSYDVFMKIIGKHLSYLASLACHGGIPRSKVFLHSIAQGVDQYNMDELVNPYGNPGASFYGEQSLRANASFMRAVQAAKEQYGATGYCYGEFNLNTTDHTRWLNWFRDSLLGDPDCVFQALYNYDSMKDKPAVEQAMLDAMALCPEVP